MYLTQILARTKCWLQPSASCNPYSLSTFRDWLESDHEPSKYHSLSTYLINAPFMFIFLENKLFFKCCQFFVFNRSVSCKPQNNGGLSRKTMKYRQNIFHRFSYPNLLQGCPMFFSRKGWAVMGDGVCYKWS